MNYIIRHFCDHVSTAGERFGSLESAERKWSIRYQWIEGLAICLDVGTILLTGLVAALLHFVRSSGTSAEFTKTFTLAMTAAALFVLLIRGRGLYAPTELVVFKNQARAILRVWFFWVLPLLALSALHMHALGASDLLFALLGPAFLVGQRSLLGMLLLRSLSRGTFSRTNVLLITDQPAACEAKFLRTLSKFGFRVISRFTLSGAGRDPASLRRLGARVIDTVRRSEVDEILIEAHPDRWSELRPLVAELEILPISVVFIPAGGAAELFRRPKRHLGSAFCVQIQREPLSAIGRVSKRLIDIVGAALALIVLAPLLVLVAIAIKLDSPGPVLFRQHRCGFNGRVFLIRKFRTMSVAEDGPFIVQAVQSDQRVTRVGRWLRRTSIDELPQLINVLDGSMSLVGPRPHAIAHDGQFEKLISKYASRQRVKPGLTGWAQIHGCRGPTPTPALIERRVEYDLWYVDNWSIPLDLAILLRTPIEVLRGRNAC